jgi:hypothetical protein
VAAGIRRPGTLKVKFQADRSVNGECLKKYQLPTE